MRLYVLFPTYVDCRYADWYEQNTPCPVTLAKRTLDFPTSLLFLQNFALPNFFFHMVTAYSILRNAGVDVGKMDYLGMGTLTDKTM